MHFYYIYLKQLQLKFIIYLFLSFGISFGYAQKKKYPKDYFRSPLDIPLILSGTFGELRSNHFHSGIDIKTQGKEGLPIYAIADGYVSRIRVSQYGFGKALYITHPNGYTSVYAHLSKYNDALQKYVKSIQYKKENYDTGNLFFKTEKFKIKKGELIAYSGDTGGSGGPHLHFEIRDTQTEKVINPLHFGFKIEDNRNPVIQSVKVYPLSDYAQINSQKNEIQIPVKAIGNGKYIGNRVFANGKIGLGINTFDRLNFAPNKNGVYSIEMLVNGKTSYYWDTETFAFNESKFINLHIDYPHFKKYKSRFQKTFKHPENHLSMYESLVDGGKIDVKEGLNYNVKLIIKDISGNTSEIQIPITGTKSIPLFFKPKDSTAYKVVKDQYTKFRLSTATVIFPRNTFYEDIYLDLHENEKERNVSIHTPTVPLDKHFTLQFNVSKYSDKEKEQLYIANLEYPKYPSYQETKKLDSLFYTSTKTLGNYGLLFDKQNPEIKLLYFKNNQWISNFNTLQVKITDKESGIKNYRATLDGEWILMEYNHKKGILTYNFNDKKLVGSKHIFKIVVSDNVGNTNQLSATFFKK